VNVDEGLGVIAKIMGRVTISNLWRYSKSLTIFLEISLKVASMANREQAIELLRIWVALLKRLLGYGKSTYLYRSLRHILKFCFLQIGSHFLLSPVKGINIGNTSLYNLLFTPTKYKSGMKQISDLMVPSPEKLLEAIPVILDYITVPLDSPDTEGKALLGLLPIISLNVQIRSDSRAVFPIVKRLFECTNSYGKWVLCSALNYSIQESYFSSNTTTPLERDDWMVSHIREIFKRFIIEERDNVVRDSLTTGDYYFPLGILVQYSCATDPNSDLIWWIFHKAVDECDYLLFRKLLLDTACFSLDTYSVQRRFWEKTLELIGKFVRAVVRDLSTPANTEGFTLEAIQGCFVEAFAVFHYVHPEETSLHIDSLSSDYSNDPDPQIRDFFTHLNSNSQQAMRSQFSWLRTNTIGVDAHGNEIQIACITEFIDRFLAGWVFADFSNAIFGRYPEIQNTAKYWIQETINPIYEKNAIGFSKTLIRTIFTTLENHESEPVTHA